MAPCGPPGSATGRSDFIGHLSDFIGPLSDFVGHLSDLSDTYRTLSDIYRTLSDIYRTLSDIYRTVSDTYRTFSDAYRTLSDQIRHQVMRYNILKQPDDPRHLKRSTYTLTARLTWDGWKPGYNTITCFFAFLASIFLNCFLCLFCQIVYLLYLEYDFHNKIKYRTGDRGHHDDQPGDSSKEDLT